jgi:acyl carrier protein
VDDEQVLELVLRTIRDEADDLDYPGLREVKPDTPLYGGDGGVDSLSLVRLIVAIEAAVASRFGRHIALVDEKALSMRKSPFRTAATLAQLLCERLGLVHA